MCAEVDFRFRSLERSEPQYGHGGRVCAGGRSDARPGLSDGPLSPTSSRTLTKEREGACADIPLTLPRSLAF